MRMYHLLNQLDPPNIDTSNVSILWNCNLFNQGDIKVGNYSGSGTTNEKQDLFYQHIMYHQLWIKCNSGDFYKSPVEIT